LLLNNDEDEMGDLPDLEDDDGTVNNLVFGELDNPVANLEDDRPPSVGRPLRWDRNTLANYIDDTIMGASPHAVLANLPYINPDQIEFRSDASRGGIGHMTWIGHVFDPADHLSRFAHDVNILDEARLRRPRIIWEGITLYSPPPSRIGYATMNRWGDLGELLVDFAARVTFNDPFPADIVAMFGNIAEFAGLTHPLPASFSHVVAMAQRLRDGRIFGNDDGIEEAD
jgi:hypothetical protein